ncbi:MAG: tetratricopeptide repeat protein [Alphaproteobacteria bacterium]|nr:tetratricopeptide repeat protein [Alphaproteobacteria bacterium]
MGNDNKNGFDDFEDSFFSQGEAGNFSWDEEGGAAAAAQLEAEGKAEEQSQADPDRLKAEQEAEARRQEEERLRREEEERLRREEEERLRREEEERLRREEEERLRREEEERLRREEEERLRREEEERLRREEEERLRREEEERLRREEEERLRREEEERLRREEEERLRREEEERLRREEEERLRREEEERRRRAEEDRVRQAAQEAAEDAWFDDFDLAAPAEPAAGVAPPAVEQAVEPEVPQTVEPEVSQAVEPEAPQAEPEAPQAEPEAPQAEPEAPQAVEPEAAEPELPEAAEPEPPALETAQEGVAAEPEPPAPEPPAPEPPAPEPPAFEPVPTPITNVPASSKTLVAPLDEWRRMAEEDDDDDDSEFDEEEPALFYAEDLLDDPGAGEAAVQVAPEQAAPEQAAPEQAAPVDDAAEPDVPEFDAPDLDAPEQAALDEDDVAQEPEDAQPVEPAAPLTPALPPLAAEPALDEVAAPIISARDAAPPADEAEAWRQAVEVLEAESAHLAGAARAAALAEAARISRTRLADPASAERLASQAVASDPDSVTAHQERMEALNANQRLTELRTEMEALAQVEPDATAAAELLHDAAVLAQRHLQAPDDAIALARASVARNPEDWFSLQLLRRLQLANGDWQGLPDTLTRMAALTDAPLAARFHFERGRVLDEELRSPALAAEAFREALAADPTFVPAFLALERLYATNADWSALAQLYMDEAERQGGADARFWRTRAARIYRSRLFDEDRARVAYEAALEGGDAPELMHEYEAFLGEAKAWDQVAAALDIEASASTGAVRLHILFRLARIQELHLQDTDAALAAWREIAGSDPAAAPAAEAVARILQERGEYAELLAFWEQRVGLLNDPNLKVTLEYRMGEICEGPLGDQEGARRHFENILDIAPGYLPALEGLERVYTRLGAWEQLAAVYEQRAILHEEPSSIALQLHRAGAVCELRMNDLDRARDFYRRALDHVPDFPPSLDAYLRLLELADDWSGLAGTLRNAAAATEDPNEQVSLYYRAARVLADKVGDREGAMACLRSCLELSPGFLSAHYLLKELTAQAQDWDALYAMQRGEAQASVDEARKAWQLLAAALLAEDVDDAAPDVVAQEILAFDPENAGARAILEERRLAEGSVRELVELYRSAATAAASDAERARLSALIADHLRDLGDPLGAVQAAGEVVASEDAEARPLVAMARLCEGLLYWEEAHRALAAAGQAFDAARLLETQLEAAEQARDGYAAVLAQDPERMAAADALIRVQRSLRDHAGQVDAHLNLARLSTQPALQAMHATAAAHHLVQLGQLDEAADAYRMAVEARPAPGRAFEELRRLLVARKDGDGLREVHGLLPEPDAFALFSDLEEIGDAEGAAAALADAADDLPSLLRLEHALESAGNWRAAFDVLRRRTALLQDPEQRARAEARQRWMLAEKLADTDEAWDLYRQLHEDSPNDTEVLEALARIAGARGETELGVQYLERLATATADPTDSARYSRQVAEIHESSGDTDAARQAYLKALTHRPEDREALAGLQRIAEANQDWQALVGVLAREASLTDGADQVALYVRIARIWQDELKDPAVAADAWRQVLELAPDDAEALGRLVGLCEASQDWSGFVEYGQAHIKHLEGAERSALQRRVGLALSDQLRDEEGALRFLDTASGGDHPDLVAAQALERLRSGRAEWDLVVDALRRQARATADDNAAIDLLVRAARLKIDTLQKRDDGAAIFEEVLDRNPAHDAALRFLSDHRFRAGDHAAAIELFVELEKKEDSWDLDDFDEKVEISLFFFHFASSLQAQGRMDDAVGKLRKALDLNPTHLPSLRMIGPIYMERKDWTEAEKVYRQVLQLTGGTGNNDALATTYTNLGRVEQALGKLDKARKRFSKALELKPNDVQALQGMASVLLSRGEWSNVLNYYNNIIYHAKEPGDVIDAYLTKGFVLDAKMNLPEKAAQHYQKTLAFDPRQPEALMRLAELSLRRRDWSEAASLADRALALDITEPRLRAHVLAVQAIALRATGDNGAASRAFEEARAVYPELSDAMGDQGIEGYEQVHEILKSRLRESR